MFLIQFFLYTARICDNTCWIGNTNYSQILLFKQTELFDFIYIIVKYKLMKIDT